MHDCVCRSPDGRRAKDSCRSLSDRPWQIGVSASVGLASSFAARSPDGRRAKDSCRSLSDRPWQIGVSASVGLASSSAAGGCPLFKEVIVISEVSLSGICSDLLRCCRFDIHRTPSAVKAAMQRTTTQPTTTRLSKKPMSMPFLVLLP